jgi:hypothetical protein
VLALGYDPLTSDLFVLGVDVNSKLAQQPEHVRLIRYQSSSGASAVLATWPRDPGAAYQVTALGHGAIVVSAGTRTHLEACRLSATDTALLPHGRVVHLGSVLGQPVMGDDYPSVALRTASGFRQVALGPFSGKGTSTFLAPPAASATARPGGGG